MIRLAFLLCLLAVPAVAQPVIWQGTQFDNNQLIEKSAKSGTGPTITVGGQGSDTNIDLNIVPKGTGKVNITNPSFVGGDLSASTVTPTNASVARTLAQHFADCDTSGAHCATFNVKDYGMEPGASSSANLTALLATISAVCTTTGNMYKTLYIPAGNYNIDTTSAWTIPCDYVRVKGDGVQSTFLFPNGTGNMFAMSAAQGDFAFSDFSIWRNDNATAGTAFVFNNQYYFLHNVTLTGVFGGVEVSSGQNVYIDNLVTQGSNSTSGSFGVWAHRTTNSSPNAIAWVTASNLSETVDEAVFIQDYDGFWLTGCHVGITRVAALLHQPQFTNDQLTGLHVTNTDFDTGGTYGIHYAALGGYTGSEGLDSIADSDAGLATTGVLLEDPGLVGLSLTNFMTAFNHQTGISITAGKNITITGSNFLGNNHDNGGSFDLSITGGSYIVAVGNNYGTWASHTGAVHVNIGGTADYIIEGGDTYQGALTTDRQNSSSGTHISFTSSQTDGSKPADTPHQQVITASSGTITPSSNASYLTLRIYGPGGAGGNGIICGGSASCSGGAGGGGGSEVYLAHLPWSGLSATSCTATVGQSVAHGGSPTNSQVQCGSFFFFADAGGNGQDGASAAASGGGGGGSPIGAGSNGSAGTGGGGAPGGATAGGSGAAAGTASNGQGGGGGGGASGAAGTNGGGSVGGSTGGGAGGGCAAASTFNGGNSGNNELGHSLHNVSATGFAGAPGLGGGGGDASATTASNGGNGAFGGGGGGGGDVCAASGTAGTGGNGGGGAVVAEQG